MRFRNIKTNIDYIDIRRNCTSEEYDAAINIENKITYSQLYKHFKAAHESTEMHPQKWYDEYVHLENLNESYGVEETPIRMVADIRVKYNE